MLNENNYPETGNGQRKVRNIFTVVILLVFFLSLLYLLFPSRPGTRTYSENKVLEEKIDIGAVSFSERLPKGFPEDIPVERENITESTSLTFSDQKQKSYKVIYFSNQSPDEVFSTYVDYMNGAKFWISPGGINRSEGIIYGSRQNDNLAVRIFYQDGKTVAEIAYTVSY